MPVLRSLVYLIGQIISVLVVSPIALLCLVLPSLLRARIISSWARFNIWSLKHLCGITYHVTGTENIPDRPAVLISNHQSAWETLCYQLIFPPQSYILKWSLLWIPFFGWGLAANRPVAINRSKKGRALDQLIKQGTVRLNEGRWLVIFPEGTRMPPGSPGKFQAGGAMVASRTGAPVVPVAHNAGVFWPKKSFLKHPGTIEVVIGKTIETTNKKPREINTEVETWINQTLQTLPLGYPLGSDQCNSLKQKENKAKTGTN